MYKHDNIKVICANLRPINHSEYLLILIYEKQLSRAISL